MNPFQHFGEYAATHQLWSATTSIWREACFFAALAAVAPMSLGAGAGAAAAAPRASVAGSTGTRAARARVILFAWLLILFSTLHIALHTGMFITFAASASVTSDHGSVVLMRILGDLPFLGLMGVGGLIVGAGLLRLAPWARIAGIVYAVLNLPMGIGLFIGLFGLVALFHPNARALFARREEVRSHSSAALWRETPVGTHISALGWILIAFAVQGACALPDLVQLWSDILRRTNGLHVMRAGLVHSEWAVITTAACVVPNAVGGWGMLRLARRARPAGIAVSALNLVIWILLACLRPMPIARFPVGLLVAIYGLILLCHPAAIALFKSGRARPD